MCHMSCFGCHMACVGCHMACVGFHMSCVTCRVSCVTFFSSLKLVELVGGGFVINGTKCVTMILESGFGFNEVPASQKT